MNSAALFSGNGFVDTHTEHVRAAIPSVETLAALSHGLAQASIVFMVGLAAFAAFVWRPMRAAGSEGGESLLCRAVWVLAGLLFVAGMVELPVFAARASGESLSFGVMYEAVFETRVGNVWMARLGLGLLAAYAITESIRSGSGKYRAIGFALGGFLVATLTFQSHAATAGGFMPIASDWLHVVAGSVWMGGLLGFPVLLAGPLRTMEKEERAKLLGESVRRFTRMASVAVTALVVTGVYASLVHIPSFDALVSTAYGRALIMKLGLVSIMLPMGAINMMDRGGGPFERMVYAELALAFLVFAATGFLTTLPPPG
jgi:copper transport protein